MIQRPTVFIIGAGASVPYNFPSGEKLRRDLIEHASFTPSRDAYINGDPTKALKDALRGSKLASIDEFLENRSDLLELGKLCIAKELIDYEHHDCCHCTASEDWLQSLWGALHRDARNEISRNNVTFINFNYDRVLEHALTEAMTHSFRLPRHEAWNEIQKVNIIHPHGLLGKYCPLPNEWDEIKNGDWSKYIVPRNDGCRHFTRLNNSYKLNKTAADGLHLYWEKGEHRTMAQRSMTSALENAERVIFLGFGFLDANMRQLMPMLDKCKAKEWAATTLGLGERHVRLLQKQIPQFNGGAGLFNGQCRYLLDNIDNLD